MNAASLMLGANDWLHSFWMKPGNSDLSVNPDGTWHWAGVDGLFMYILWVCIISFVLLMGVMTYFAIKYRRRPGVAQQRSANHSTALEVSWVVVPAIIVFIIFFWGFHGYMRAQVAKVNAEEILVEGFMWSWDATYPNGAKSPWTVYLDDNRDSEGVGDRGNIPVPVFVVPAGRPVKFRLTSRDVVHSFYIPDMRLKMDTYPNRYTSMTFTPINADSEKDQAGTLTPLTAKEWAEPRPGRDHYIFCAEFCGKNHSQMAAILRVVSEQEYQKILAAWSDIVGRNPPVEVGKIVWKAKGCAQCHTVDGGKGSAPSWLGYYGQPLKFADGRSLDASLYPELQAGASFEDVWDNYIRESILNPGAHLHEGYPNQMPSYQGKLSAGEINGVIAYMRQLNGKARAIDTQMPGEAAPAADAPGTPTPAPASN